MPAFIGGAKVISVIDGGSFHVGDAVEISPKHVSKGYHGSGNDNTGDFPMTHNLVSSTNTNDMDVKDQNVTTPI